MSKKKSNGKLRVKIENIILDFIEGDYTLEETEDRVENLFKSEIIKAIKSNEGNGA